MATTAVAAAAQAIASSALVISIGLAAGRANVLTATGAKQLSGLQATFLEPALAFSALSSLSAADLADSWSLLVWAPLHCVCALILAHLLLPKSPRRGALLLCTAFGNAGALPNALVPALLPYSAAKQGLLCVQVYLVTWRLLLWSVGPALLVADAAAAQTAETKKTDGVAASTPTQPGTPSLRALLLPPPSIGSLLGLCVALAPPALRRLLLGRGAPLGFISAAATQAGAAAAPAALITLGFALGGNGAAGADGDKSTAAAGGGGSSARGRGPEGAAAGRFTTWELAACVGVRLLLMPCAHLLLIVYGLPLLGMGAGDVAAVAPAPRAWGSWVLPAWVPPLGGAQSPAAAASAATSTTPASAAGGVSDPFALVLLLQAGMPSAVSVQAIFQRGGADTTPLAPLMIAQYVIAAPAVVLQVAAASAILGA